MTLFPPFATLSILFAGAHCAIAQSAIYPSTKEGVSLTGTLSKIDSSNTRVSCSILNRSKYPLVSLNRRTDCGSFQFRLVSQSGEVIPQEKKWAEKFVQKGSYPYEYPQLFLNDVILPGDKMDFSFNLHEAYGARADLGDTLEILWENAYPGSEVEIGGRPNPDGKVLPLHKEKFYFPKDFKLGFYISMVGGDGVNEEAHSNAEGNLKSNVMPIKGPSGSSLNSSFSETYSQLKTWWLLLAFLTVLLVLVFTRKGVK